MIPLTDGPLAELRAKPIADEVALAMERRADYRAHPVDLGSPEQSQPMAEVRDFGIAGENAYHAPAHPPYYRRIPGSTPALWLREGLIERLRRVNARLEPYGCELWVFDTWRPIAVQNYFFDHWMPAFLEARHPDLSKDQLRHEAEKYWARGAPDGVIDPLSPPPHATGAAIDLTIRYLDGAELFMGSLFDDVTEVSNTAYFEGGSAGLSVSAEEARANRRLLYWLMVDEGFANNPTEWWHFSYGDQMWARIYERPAALYGPADPDRIVTPT